MIYVLYVTAALAALVLLLLLLPFSVKLKLRDEKFSAKLYYSGIKVYDTDKPPKKKKKSKQKETFEDEASPKKESFIVKLKNERGFKGAVEYLVSVIKIVLTVLKGILKHIKITQTVLKISVASFDAAETAVTYGAVCSAVYPCMALIENNMKFKAQKIDISSDFSGEESRIYLSCKIKANLLTAVVFEILKPKNFKKIKKECEKL